MGVSKPKGKWNYPIQRISTVTLGGGRKAQNIVNCNKILRGNITITVQNITILILYICTQF